MGSTGGTSQSIAPDDKRRADAAAEVAGGSIENATRQPRFARGTVDAPGQRELEGERPGREGTKETPDARLSELGGRIRRMYLINQRNEYRLLAQPQRVAFRDWGRRLVTEHDDPSVIRGMLDVAQHKGWERINLVGSETFRRVAWLEAGVRGFETTGYAPTPEDRKRLGEWLDERDGRDRPRTSTGSAVPKASDAYRARKSQGDFGANSREIDGAAVPAKGRPVAEIDRDAVVLAVAEEVLRKRQVGEVTRARVAAAIARRLCALRDQGTSVSVRMHDPAARASDGRPVEVSRRQEKTDRSR